ncbi:hypothetical protein cypCar_00001337 [Cyprinus carpio]|nr:hypothetical protein cypCar_00001337 [Cyprinus carpio]
MTDGPRQRGSAVPSTSEDAAADTGKAAGQSSVALKKEIGLVSACGIIVGNIIGSGIFVSPKGVLENASSVGLALIVWIITGIITAIGALCYAELGVTIPKSGGDYSYVKDIFGGLAGFLRLWIAVLVIYPTNQAVIALTFSNYVLQPLFPTCFPPENGLRLLAAICLLLLTWVNCASVRWATRVQDVFTAGKLLALILIIIMGIVQICKGEYYWLEPANAFKPFQDYDVDVWLFFAGAREGHLPSLLAMIHVKRCTPIPALLFTCISTLLMLCTSDMYTLINYVGFINYLFYGVTVAGQIVLRVKQPDMHRPIKISLVWPVIYLLFWAFLLIFSLYSEPVVCGIGLAIMLTGVPVYFLAVYWDNKPQCINTFVGKMTYLGQKFCVVVYPMEDEKKNEESGEEIELKEQSVPLSAEDEQTPKSADC